MKRSTLVIGLILVVLIVDQAIKVWVKTHMLYGEMIPIFGWDRALIHFVENDGMAFGKRFNIPHGKLILSLFRIVAAAFLFFALGWALSFSQVSLSLFLIPLEKINMYPYFFSMLFVLTCVSCRNRASIF